MKSRTIALVTAAAAITLLAGCGSSQSAAMPSVVTVTTVVTASPTTVDQTEESTTDTREPLTPQSPPTTEDGAGASAYVGHYQRHESLLDLAADRTGTLLIGANALDGERWAISWQPEGQGITITFDRLLEKFGAGLRAGLAPGRSFAGQLTSGKTGNQVLSTSAIPPEIIASIWCLPGKPSPECGA